MSPQDHKLFSTTIKLYKYKYMFFDDDCKGLIGGGALTQCARNAD
jgi:hypothetical protein